MEASKQQLTSKLDLVKKGKIKMEDLNLDAAININLGSGLNSSAQNFMKKPNQT